MSTLKYDPLAAGIGKKCDGYWCASCRQEIGWRLQRQNSLKIVIMQQ
jgi:hypothetical protein